MSATLAVPATPDGHTLGRLPTEVLDLGIF
jgi:hypothetical protein